MKLFVPACGDRIVLAAPWSFDLYVERRNIEFGQILGVIDRPAWQKRDWREEAQHGPRKVGCTLPKGTVLECDRVYIRAFSRGAKSIGKDFDSITWRVMKGGKPARKQRFWAKLHDCCEIEYRLESDSLYRDRIKAVREVQES